MPRSSWFLFVLSAGLFNGCVHYHPRELDPATERAQLESRTLSDPGLRAFLAARGQSVGAEWNVEQLTLAAFYYSPELDLARARLAELEAGVRTARALPNPGINITPGYNQDAAAGVTPWILAYGLNLPLDLGGGRALRTAEARWQEEAARLDLAANAWRTRRAVHRALIDLRAAEAAAAFWHEQQPLLTRAAQLAHVHAESGETSPFVAAQAQIALNRAELSAREGRRAVAHARSRFAETLGVNSAALEGIAFASEYLGATSSVPGLSEARVWASQNRTDVLSALAAYGASQAALQREIVRQYPGLNIGPGYQLDQGEAKWSLSLSFDLPLFHRNQGPIAAAEARRVGAAAQFLIIQNRALAEVDRAFADHAAAFDDLRTAQAMRASLQKQSATIAAQQQAGEISLLELIRVQLELADIARAELDSRTRAEQALAALEDALQRPLTWDESAWRVGPTRTHQPL